MTPEVEAALNEFSQRVDNLQALVLDLKQKMDSINYRHQALADELELERLGA